MSATIFVIKTALLRFGVVMQDVKFDVDNECVVVRYTLKGVGQTKSVPFSDIEDLFTSDLSGPGAPEPGERQAPDQT